jgi:hypothetical protein
MNNRTRGSYQKFKPSEALDLKNKKIHKAYKKTYQEIIRQQRKEFFIIIGFIVCVILICLLIIEI